VKNKARLGRVARRKTTSCVALTQVIFRSLADDNSAVVLAEIFRSCGFLQINSNSGRFHCWILYSLKKIVFFIQFNFILLNYKEKTISS